MNSPKADLTLGEAKEKELNYALSNTFGFSGIGYCVDEGFRG